MPTEAPSRREVETDLQALLARSGAKDRASIEKHLAAVDAEPDAKHGQLWRRLAAKLGSLAPMPVQTLGNHAVQFFIPDGKYRMQVFALEDQRDGKVAVYLPNILADGIRKKLVKKSKVEGEYAIPGAATATLHLEEMDSANTPEPPQHVKHMLGWNRKAVKLTLPAAGAGAAQIKAVEALCDLAAKAWTPAN